MTEWRASTWGEEISLEYGKGLRGYGDSTGGVPVYGTNGPVGWTDEPLAPGPGVILGRKGAYRGVHFSRKPFFVIDTAYYVVPKTELDMRWLYYAMIYHKLGEIDDGSPIPSTTRSAVYPREIDVPKINEQRAIAAILGALDDKIDLNSQMNETLEATVRAFFKSWFVDFDPVRAKMEGRGTGLAADVAALFPDGLDEEEVGQLPKGWAVSSIGQEVDVMGGNTPSTKDTDYWGGQCAFATPKDLSNLNAPLLLATERHLTEAGVNRVSSGLLPSGTVLMSSRAPIGYVAISSIPVCVNQGFAAMVCRRSIGPIYAYFWTLFSMDEIKSRASGSTFPEISKSAFREIKFVRPPELLSDTFEKWAAPLFDRISINLHNSQTLSQTRDLLLPKLMSGEICIKDAEKLVGEAGA